MQHYMMLQQDLLYTAVTRAKKVLILIGSRIAIRNNDNNNRHTALDLRLRGDGYAVLRRGDAIGHDLRMKKELPSDCLARVPIT